MLPMTATTFAITLVAALGSAAVGGLFYAFSSIVMPGLERMPEAQGIAAMQSINVAAPRPPLLVLLMGTGLACLALIVLALLDLGAAHSVWLLVGAVVYLVGTIGLTGARNIPLNDALAEVEPQSHAGAEHWGRYLDQWTAWNHVRGLAGLAAGAAFVVALTV